MNTTTPETLGPDEQTALREEVRQLMASDNLTLADIARESGIGHSTLSAWINGTYKGDNADKAAGVLRWLETRHKRTRTMAVLPSAPAFQLTQTAEHIFNILSFSQTAPDFGVIVGGAGIGKTTAIEEYQRRASNVHVVTMEPCLASPNNMLSALAEEIGVLEKRSSWISRAICAKIRNTGALIVIDEAQHLSSQALDQLRTTVLDRARCGVVVSGNESVYARLQGAGDARNAQFAQLYSRVGMRASQGTVRAKDVCTLLAAWGITDPDALSLLKVIARKPGALRGMTKTIRLAFMLAAGDGATFGAKYVRQAWSQLSATAIEAA